jgi:hypothetical protein
MRWMLAVALVAGCGDAAAPTDAAVDVVSPSAVRLTVTRRGLPAAGARVVFQDLASNVVSDTVTREDGVAAAEVEAGDFVTLVEPKDPPVGPNPPPTINDRLATFAAVEPGDELHIDLEPKPPTVVVTMSAPPMPGATLLQVTSTCGNGSISQVDDVVAPAQITLGDCRGSADFALVATDGVTPPTHGMYREANTIGDHAVVALTGAWAPLVTSTVTPDPPPSWVVYMGIDLAVRSSRGTVLTQSQLVDPAAPAATFTLPPTTGTTAAISVTMIADTAGFARQQLLRWGLPVIDPVVSTTPLLLAPYTTLPVFDLPTRTMRWTEGPGAVADAVRAEIHTFRDGFPAHAWDWQLIAPRGAATSVTYPVWPAGREFDFGPKAGDSSGMRDLEMVSAPGGYRAIRPHALRTRLDVPTSTPTGQLSHQQVSNQQN